MQIHFLPHGQTGDLGVRSKDQISLNFNYKVNFKEFIPNFACVPTNKRYEIYRTEFSFCRLSHAPGVGLWGTGRLKT